MKVAQQHRTGRPGAPAKADNRCRAAEAGSDDEEGTGSGDDSSEGEQEGEGEGAAAAGEGGRVGQADLARTLHDILAGMPPQAPGLGARQGGAAGGQGGEEEGEDEEGGAGLRSWCGAAEVGIVAAANAGQGARQRKRQRQLLGQADGGGEEQQRAKWASAKAQQRMYRWGGDAGRRAGGDRACAPGEGAPAVDYLLAFAIARVKARRHGRPACERRCYR